MPLLLRGARQVGKTHLVSTFGQQEFRHFVHINFELNPEHKNCFISLEPESIVTAIEAVTKTKVISGDTLLFLDEIQECPNAINALRYFKEKMPELHVIAAGSLLEFAINDEDTNVPVGRVQSLYLKPMTFKEYLLAAGYHNILEILANLTVKNTINPAINHKLEQLLREYFVLGGMPAVINHYIEHKDVQYCNILQLSLLNTFRNDFGKYASKVKHKYLQKIFEQAPVMIDKHFQFSKVDPHMQARDLREALDALKDAGLLYDICATAASGLPLNMTINAKKFKILFLDVGLTKASSNIDAAIMLQKELLLINQGQLVEQFVGQELLAHMPPYTDGKIFYWQRDKHGSTAEIDYITNINDNIIAIEVKSGKTGRLKSLQSFLQDRSAGYNTVGVRISLHPLAFDRGILSIPLYMVHELKRLVTDLG